MEKSRRMADPCHAGVGDCQRIRVQPPSAIFFATCAVDSNFDQSRPLHIVHEAVDELKSYIIVVIAVLFLGIVICCPNAL